jgi:single-strand DNA-binding protein
MNLCIFTGRLVADPELRYTPSGVAIATFRMAVDRPVKKGEEKKADFPQFKAFGKTAECCASYFRKGFRETITAQFQTGSYETQDGQKRYTNDFIVQKVFPIDWPEKTPGDPGIVKQNVESVNFDDLPF